MTIDVPVLHMAAFAAAPGGGNPAGVVPDASSLDDAQMQQIATELGYPESAFVVDPAIGGDPRHVRVRYFSPGAEVPFCGHATIATAVHLAEEKGAGEFVLETAVGRVVISTQDAATGITASFTSVRPDLRDLAADTAATLLGLLGLTAADLDPALPLRESFAGNWHPIVAIRDQSVFDVFTFDPASVRALMDAQGWTGTVTVVHAMPDAADEFEARNLFPVGTITEDPATGSAAASFGAYLRAIGAVTPPARITVHQGRHVGRPSILQVDIPASGGITVTGTAQVTSEIRTAETSDVEPRPPLASPPRVWPRPAAENAEPDAGVRHSETMTDSSDDEWTVARHLAGQPEFAVELYTEFIRMLESIGPFTYSVSKSMITVKGVRRGFAGARPVAAGLRGYLDLQREVHDRRITSCDPYTKRLFVHHFRVETPADLDDEFLGWLREASAVGAGEHLRP